MKSEKLVLVDEKDNVVGYEEKEKCHEGNGILHRAFSVFIFNDKRELLMQQRSHFKKLWPLYWSNTCCSHPRVNESYETAAKRRLFEECGFNCELKYLYKFNYSAKFKNIGSENELCAVLIGKFDENSMKISQNSEEIADFKWAGLDEILLDMHVNKNNYTPWFKIEFESIIYDYFKEVEKFI